MPLSEQQMLSETATESASSSSVFGNAGYRMTLTGIGSGGSMEKMENGKSWYLAQYLSGGKNRERLFGWLSDQHITPWTPLTTKIIRRTDKINSTRKRILPLFPGYFFLKADLATQTVDNIRRHSAFCGFVMRGSQIAPLRPSIVTSLMKMHPDPTLNPAAKEELKAASETWLTTAQYQSLLRMEQDPSPVSRVTMLMQLAFEHG